MDNAIEKRIASVFAYYMRYEGILGASVDKRQSVQNWIGRQLLSGKTEEQIKKQILSRANTVKLDKNKNLIDSAYIKKFMHPFLNNPIKAPELYFDENLNDFVTTYHYEIPTPKEYLDYDMIVNYFYNDIRNKVTNININKEIGALKHIIIDTIMPIADMTKIPWLDILMFSIDVTIKNMLANDIKFTKGIFHVTDYIEQGISAYYTKLQIMRDSDGIC